MIPILGFLNFFHEVALVHFYPNPDLEDPRGDEFGKN